VGAVGHFRRLPQQTSRVPRRFSGDYRWHGFTKGLTFGGGGPKVGCQPAVPFRLGGGAEAVTLEVRVSMLSMLY